MTIGIDISQLAYKNTGVANFLQNLVENLVKQDSTNKYVLFFSSMRRDLSSTIYNLQSNSNVKIKRFRIPPTILDLLWNKLHILPIENFIGDVDVFITSDWTEPPTRSAKKITILYDLLIYKYPEEMHNKTEFNPLRFLISPNIVASQKRKLKWVKKESNRILCISQSTARDAMTIMGIDSKKLDVIYPGF